MCLKIERPFLYGMKKGIKYYSEARRERYEKKVLRLSVKYAI